VNSESVEKIAEDLAKIVRGDVFADILHRAAFSSDASIYRIIPGCVVSPRDVGDVVTVVRYSSAKGIPVAARGAGSGVAGESLCQGIVLDTARYMHRILHISEDGERVTCEPGVVLDTLNNFLADYGTKIGPDPSSGNRATVGGCVANNATGAHSLSYGYMADYVESIEAVLADGTVVEFVNNFQPEQTQEEIVLSIAKRCISLLSENEGLISKSLPRSKRNRSGYNIPGVCHDGKIDLARMLAGSEGTLCVFTKITLRTVRVPAASALLQLEFDGLEEMARAVPVIVDSGAAACELMDNTLVNMAGSAYAEYRNILPVDARVTLFVEHMGQSDKQVKEKIERTNRAVGDLAHRRKLVFDASEQKRIAKARKDAVPLLYRNKGRKHPVPFIEDVSVENSRLAEYISGLDEIGRRYDIEMSYYGHAGDGELHVRPYLDLSEPADVQKMLSIANEVFSLAWSLGGSISGEHADGLVRAAFVRRQYGDEFYEVLREIKKIFDPHNSMNPGKILNSDANVMSSNLRAERKFLPQRLKSELLFAEDEFEVELGKCSGCGVCLSRETDLRMCPVYRALGEELGSSRAKANILNLWMTGYIDEKEFESADFRRFLDLCINCKACSLECPSGVDISKLMAAARAEYVRRRRLRRPEFALSHNRYLSLLGSIFSPVSNLVMKPALFKWFLEKTIGLEKRRAMPKFGYGSFLHKGRKYLASQKPIKNPVDKVVYFVDTYANYNDHELGFAVLKVLLHNDIEVILPKQRPAPLPAIVYGDVKTARRDLSYTVKHLSEAVRAGFKVVCSEPSAALCLREEMRHFVDSKAAGLVAENTFELMNYLSELFRQDKLTPATHQVSGEFLYHCPCHLLAVGDGRASIKLLDKLCGLKVEDLKAGCCGLAGTFGMQKKNYDLSCEISKNLREALAKSSSKTVLTECAACAMQIEHISDKRVLHPVKILARCYR